MPAYSKPPPGVSPEMWAQVAANYNQAEATDPTFAGRMQQRSDETNALRAAQTGSMGMLQSGPMSSGVADPAAAFERFSKSGYSGADAVRDGWLTGTGSPGWQTGAGYQAEPTGMFGGGTATPDPASSHPPAAPAPTAGVSEQIFGNSRPPSRPWRPADRPAMQAMYGDQKPATTATPATPAHWDMGDYGAAGSWSNGYNPHWVGGETQPPPSTSTAQPQATQTGQTQQPAAQPGAQPGGSQRAFGAAPRWAGGQAGGGRRRVGQQPTAMGNMYGGG